MADHGFLTSGASLVALVAATMLGGTAAMAQDVTPPATPANATPTQPAAATAAPAAEGGGDIVVTGSRLVSNGFQAPTPVTVVSEAQLRAAAPTSLSDALNQLPVFANSSTPSNTGVTGTANAGQSFLNLRSLGQQRTLVLLDGRRVVSSTAAGSVDVSVLPEVLVSRVDVVTGGASAAYGSDAVAGVVNFILDTKFQGIKLDAQAGTSERGDYGSRRIDGAFGTALFGDRGHFIASAGYYKNDGVKNWKSRDWFHSCARISNPALVPNTLIACDLHAAAFTRGGLITGGPLRGTEFGPGGVPQTFTYGALATATSMIGGSGEDNGANFPVVPLVERKTAFAHFDYDATDHLSFYVEGLYGNARSYYESTAPWEGQGTGYTIYSDNAFLPLSIKQRMAAAGVTSIAVQRYNYDFGLLTIQAHNKTYRGVAGVKAEVGGFTGNLYYEHGENDYYQTTAHNPIINRLYNAADAVVGPGGQIVCRSTLTQPGNGCVPLNIFGYGSPSQEALGWATGTNWQKQVVKQDVVDLNVTGKPFSTWAGEVSVAFGGGYRRESSVQTVDPIASSLRHFTGGYLGFPTSIEGQLGGWERTNPQPLAGHYDVKEVFGEVLVPLLRDSAIGRSADLNAAARYTNYSTSGGVTTWKVGLTYEPVSGIRLRGTRSRDIRAANLTELFSGSTQAQNPLTDPFQPVGSANRTPAVTVRTVGNADLKPERADTTTAGVVFQPAFLPGLSASVDYYDIKIKQAIGTLTGQVQLDQCFAGVTSLCALLQRDATGLLVSMTTPYLNISSRATSGLDFEASYRTEIAGGSLGIRGLATYIHRLTLVSPGAPPIQLAGQLGTQTGGSQPGLGVPHWVASLSANYKTRGGTGLYVQERFTGAGALDKTLSATALAPEENHVDHVFYTDLTLTQEIHTGFSDRPTEIFLTVNNLFDKNPPLAPSPYFVFGVANGGTNPALYDVIGRQFVAGARLRF